MAAMVALSSSPFAVVAGATAVPRVGLTSRSAARSTARIFPRHRHALVVKCQSEPEMKPILENSAADQPTPNPNPAPNKPKPKASSKLSDVLAFSGPGPERINGRLAMVGFVAALVVEAARGDGLLSQAGSGAGAAWFAGTAAVLTAASLVPLLRGESVQDRTEGVMNANAELWNGRFAMVGLLALAFTEYLKGGPLV